MRALILALALAACATAPTAAGIARDLDAQLRALATWPISTRCQSVDDACDRCKRSDLSPRCWADGWNDQDRDAWVIAVCLPRASRCSAEREKRARDLTEDAATERHIERERGIR